jgi:DNA-binding NarL/FixJ family response regulator
MQDMTSKGRAKRGKKAKLKESQIIAILGDARKQKDIAKDYGVCRKTIRTIKNNKMWKDVELC